MAAVCGLALACGAACVAEPESIEGDDAGERDVAIKGAVPADAYPEAVLVDMMRDGRVVGACSGAILAARFVLTAGHCVRHQSAWRVTSPALGMSADVDLAAPFDLFEDGELVDRSSRDVGILRLVTPLALSAYPALADAPLPNGKRVVDVGRIEDGAISFDALFASRPVKIHDAADIGFPYAYRAIEKIEPGDSGGPAFVAGSGPHVIAAVASGSGGGVELLARVDLVRDWIGEWMATHAGASIPADERAPCEHDICENGASLDATCADPCVALVCEGDPYCCATAWDESCLFDAALICGACI